MNQSHKVSETQDQLDNLYNWGIKNGAYLSNIKLTSSLSSNNMLIRTATSTTIVPALNPLFSTPLNLRISENLCRESDVGQLLQKHLSSKSSTINLESWHQTSRDPLVLGVLFIITYLLSERSNPKSFWLPYLESLPKDVSSLPITWSDSFIQKNLAGTQLLTITHHRKKLLLSGFETIRKALEGVLVIHYEEFIWCYCMVSSRAFPDLQIMDQVCLYPILDILDHSPDTKITWFHSETNTQFIHHTTIQKGELLLNNYGQKGNQNLLSNYGFVIDGNLNDYFVLGLNGKIRKTLYLKLGLPLEGMEDFDDQSLCDLWNVVGEQFFKLKDAHMIDTITLDLSLNEKNARIYKESQMQIFKYHMSMLRKRFESIGKIVHVVDLDYSKNDKNFFLSDVCLGHLPEESLLALILTGYKLELADIPFLDEVQNEDMIDHFTKDIQSNLLSSVTSNEFCLAASFVQERMIVLGSHVLRYLGSKCSETIIVILKETIS